MFAREIRKRRTKGIKSSRWRWHGEDLESFVTKTRDKKAALKFLTKAMRKNGRPEVFVTDRLPSYGAALKEIGAGHAATAAQVALNWLVNFHGEAIVAIPGASKPRHAQEAAGSMAITLNEEELKRLDELTRSFK